MENPGETLGVIAGSGLLPHAVTAAARADGYRVSVFGLAGLASEDLEKLAHSYRSVAVGRLGQLIRELRRADVRRVVFAGKVSKTLLYRMNIVPDLRAVRVLMSLPDRKDDTIMEAILGELEKEGIAVAETTAFTRPLMAAPGVMSRREPTRAEWEDVRFGAALAREMGRLDVGQTVIVKRKAVMAVEAIEGTDAAIRRGGELAGGGAVVVKTAKPAQDLRFDVPVVGPDTLESLIASKGSVLAVEAGKVIVMERERLLERADEAGVAVVGFDD